MSKRLFLLLFLLMAGCCKDGKAQALTPCNPQTPDPRYSDGAYFVMFAPVTGACYMTPLHHEPQRQMIPLYTTSALFDLTRATAQPSNGDDLWCVANPPAVDYPVRLILPAVVREDRTLDPIAGGTTPAMGVTPTGPQAELSIWTPVQPTPQPGSTPWASYVVLYPLWSPSDAACAGNPSIAFAAGSLGTGEARVSAQVLIVY